MWGPAFHHVRMAQHLHPTMGGTYPITMSKRLSTYIWPWEEHIQGPCQKHLVTYIWPWEEHIQEPCQKGLALMSHHGRNTSKNHVEKAQHLYPSMWGTHRTSMLEGLNTYIYPYGEHIPHPCYKGSTLRSDHVGTHPTISLEWICTYIWSCGNTSCNHIRMGLHLYLIMWQHIPQSHQNGSTLIMWEHIPQSHQNISTLIYDHVGTNTSIT